MTVLFGFLVFVHCQPGVRDGLVVRCFKHSVRFNIRKGKQTQTLELKSFRWISRWYMWVVLLGKIGFRYVDDKYCVLLRTFNKRKREKCDLCEKKYWRYADQLLGFKQQLITMTNYTNIFFASIWGECFHCSSNSIVLDAGCLVFSWTDLSASRFFSLRMITSHCWTN